jgi:hypothetical protein
MWLIHRNGDFSDKWIALHIAVFRDLCGGHASFLVPRDSTLTGHLEARGAPSRLDMECFIWASLRLAPSIVEHLRRPR